jgi:PAS domain S-box-containing protein
VTHLDSCPHMRVANLSVLVAAVQYERDRLQRILLALDLKGRITRINRHACDVLGWTEGELLGSDWIDMCLPILTRPALRTTFADLVGGGNLFIVENPVLTRTGEERLIEWHNTTLLNDAGAVIGTCSSGADLTERPSALDGLLAVDERTWLALESTGATKAAAHDLLNDLVEVLQLLHLDATRPLPAQTQRIAERMVDEVASKLQALKDLEMFME